MCLAFVFTLLVQKYHDAVSVCVSVKMSPNNMAILSEDGNQPLVVALSHSSDVSGKRQEPHRDMSNHVNLDEKIK